MGEAEGRIVEWMGICNGMKISTIREGGIFESELDT
jgi:hypothetical protein